MAGERRYTRIPPESTGDRVHVRHGIDIPYTNRTGTILRAMTVKFSTSQAVGTVTQIRVDSGTVGVISVTFDIDTIDNNVLTVAGENITDEDGNILAQVGSTATTEIYTNVSAIVGYTDQYNGLKVDRNGAASIRFTEGPASLDAFGKLRISEATILGDYFFQQGVDTINWTVNTAGAGTITHDTNGKNILFTTTAASGDVAEYRTDQYHHYVPGVSQTILMTCAAGDAGKTGLVREWGYFDDKNGMFFRKNGTTLSVVIRENTSGVVNETEILQNDWNSDRLDGTGLTQTVNLSGFNIDTTMDNVYWMDMQWLGGGRIRFGVYIDGVRAVCHEYYHANRYPRASMQTGSLPVTVRQENTGVVGSTSEFKFWCAGVSTDGRTVISDLGNILSGEIAGITSAGTETLIGSIRPIAAHPSGDLNRNIYFPQNSNVGAYDTVAGAQGAIVVRVYQGGVISGGAWVQKTGTTLETNLTGTIGTPGVQVAEYHVFGNFRADLSSIYKSTTTAVKNKSDGTQQGFYVTAERLYGANDVNVAISFGLKELPN